MKKLKSLIVSSKVLFFLFLNVGCQQSADITNSPVQQFNLWDVTLLDGPYKKATDLNVKSLLTYEPDRLLAKYRIQAGLEPKAPHYHGWEDATISGHSLGHYLSACALMYQTSGNSEFLERVKYIVNELEECQNADPDGYIGAFPDGKRILEEEIAKGDIRSQGFDLNGIWVPFYNQHKFLAGLRDAYHLCGEKKALQIATRFADWLYTVLDVLNNDQIQEMLHCEHGGINEVMVDLYTDTGNKKYLDLANIFYHEAILDPLSEGKDILPGKHGNTQIPKLIGLARRFEEVGDSSDYKAATFFWDRVVNHHSYVTGGHGNHEYFGQPDELTNRLSDETTETCNVYNMLKLTSHLFTWEPSVEIADYYERALINQILSSQSPIDGSVVYNLSLEMGGYKSFQNPVWFTCCIGTGMENHSQYGNNIYYFNDSELYVSQFIASEAKWKQKGVSIKQTTKFPGEQGTNLQILTKSSTEFTLKIRYPNWAGTDFEIKLNGDLITLDAQAGNFITIDRVWKNNDLIEIKFPFSIHIERMPDNANRIAFMYGPLVMAGDLGPVNDPDVEKPDYVPILVTEDKNPSSWLEKKGEFEYAIKGVGKPRDISLKPFYSIYSRRYTVYFDLFNNEEWVAQQKTYETELLKRKEMEKLTIDFFQPGEMQPERDHNFQGDSIYIQDFKNKKARVANRGGWFSFDMNIKADAYALVIEYWGGFTGSKTFDILVDDQKIATENISGKADGRFIDVAYEIPPEILEGKSKIRVKFVPHVGSRAGPFFGARIIRQ